MLQQPEIDNPPERGMEPWVRDQLDDKAEVWVCGLSIFV
jgi:hypothetical protein